MKKKFLPTLLSTIFLFQINHSIAQPWWNGSTVSTSTTGDINSGANISALNGQIKGFNLWATNLMLCNGDINSDANISALNGQIKGFNLWATNLMQCDGDINSDANIHALNGEIKGLNLWATSYLKADGNVDIAGNVNIGGITKLTNLATGSTKMVVADATGNLSTQTVPTDNQTLSIAGSTLSISGGNSVTIPSGGDNLGNHTATTNLNMSLKDILNVNSINVKTNIDMGTGKLSSTFQGITTDNRFFIGGTPSTTSYQLYVYGNAYADGGIWQASDKNFKRNIEPLSDIKNKLFGLLSYQYNFKTEEFPERNFDNRLHYGFIAQEVEKVFPSLTRNEGGHYAINYTEFIPLMLQALKDEDSQIQNQEQTIANLKNELDAANTERQVFADNIAKITELENKLAALEASMEACCLAKNNNNNSDIKLNDNTKSTLNQNIPNPFNHETTISYNIVTKYQAAFIGIYSLNGEQISKIAIPAESNTLTISAGELKPGMYVYALIVDNELIDSKKMIVNN